eukprot:78851_1
MGLDKFADSKYYPCLSIIWTIFTGLLASACCAIQLIINIFVNSCAGFAKLKPFRPITIPLALISLIASWIISYKCHKKCKCKQSITKPIKIAINTSQIETDKTTIQTTAACTKTNNINVTSSHDSVNCCDGNCSCKQSSLEIAEPIIAAKSVKTPWWTIPLFCTVLSMILIPMPEMVDAWNRNISSTTKYQPIQHSVVIFQLPLKCEACTHRIKSKLLKHFQGSVRVKGEMNLDDVNQSTITVYYDPKLMTCQEISEFIYNILNGDDQQFFKMKHA